LAALWPAISSADARNSQPIPFLSTQYGSEILRSFRRPSGEADPQIQLTLAAEGSSDTTLIGARISPSGTAEFSDIPRQMVPLFAYGAGRRLGRGSISETRLEDPRRSLFDEEVPLLNAEEYLIQADYAAKSAGPAESDNRIEAKKRIEILMGLLPKVLPGISKLEFKPGDRESAAAVIAETAFGRVPLRNLSSGYRSMVSWIVDFASRMFEHYPTSLEPFHEPAICLVDQIDVHLHPKWQRQLMAYLSERFPKTQFIVTAHSPLFVQAAVDAVIFVLEEKGDHVEIHRSSEKIRGWRIDHLLTSDLFGLDGARDPKTDELLREKEDILGKPELDANDQERLQQINQQVGEIPWLETPEDREAMLVLRKAAAELKATSTQQ